MATTVNHHANDDTISMILNWSDRDRAKLTYRLLLSLEDTSAEQTALSQEDLALLWEDEAQRRLADFDSGRIGCVPRDEAIRLAGQDLAK